MLVKCPGCLTTYRVGEELIKSNKPAFRCSRCKLVFGLELQPKEEPEHKGALPPQADRESADSQPDLPLAPSDNPTTSEDPLRPPAFCDEKEASDKQANDPSIRPWPAPEFREPEDSSSSVAAQALPDQTSISSSQEHPAEEFPIETPPVSAGLPLQSRSLKGEENPSSARPEEDPVEGDNKKAPQKPPASESRVAFEEPVLKQGREADVADNPRRDGGPLSIIQFVRLFGLLILGFSILTLMYEIQPERWEGYIKSLPWLGSTLLKNNHLHRGVAVGSLQTGYHRIVGDREVFVITGRITNRNPVSVGEIQVEGRIHASGGNELARQTTSVGNPISSKIIRDMTPREIAILQRLRPQKKFDVPPQGSAAFTIIFVKPSQEIQSISCQVVSAKASA